MNELKYRMEVIAVLILSFFMMMYGAYANDRFVLLFFMVPFPLSFIAGVMWKEGRL